MTVKKFCNSANSQKKILIVHVSENKVQNIHHYFIDKELIAPQVPQV